MDKYKHFSKEEIASWPEGHKACRLCQEVLPLSDYHNHKTGLMGKYHTCKPCRKPDSVVAWQGRTFEQTMLASSKFRAKKRGLAHTITLDDIVIPDTCPILGVPIVRERNHPYRPSLDQIVPRGGYTPDNVIVLSYRANALKNNITLDESRALTDWLAHN